MCRSTKSASREAFAALNYYNALHRAHRCLIVTTGQSKGQAMRQRDGQPECKETMDAEIKTLLDGLDLSKCVGVLDPWTGRGNIARMLLLHRLLVHSNDIDHQHEADWHEDALQPAFYHRVQDVRPYDAIITSPWLAMLDLLALPRATFFAPLVAMHVPSHPVTNAHEARWKYLQKLADEGRLALMMGSPRWRMGQRGGWTVVFATRALKGAMLCREATGKGAWVLT
ncbi:hypothetical protein Vafri_8766 [Volvox africanus]|uniref:Uncharacterized protein n=1 Tax=Volvox africanus TaxID=51714 RepID=A0A8J4EYA9_9CHLO|nr:hypothetical protein Vafri_8766 [Volvox africanus]